MTVLHIGIDENGLGARLGPLLVTGVLAEVDERGERLLRRKLPPRLRADLDDSKRLMSCHDVTLGEAWARSLARCQHPDAPKATTPEELFEQLSLEGKEHLSRPCPDRARPQCWNTQGETFGAEPDLLARIDGHVAFLAARGVHFKAVKSSTLCAKELNRLKEAGIHRFAADLHAMERLVLELREQAGRDVRVTCGKVGGIHEYGRFWGPLAGRLHNVLEEGRARSAYRFPGIGELAFVRDADASHPLVMVSSLVGKYLRELLMHRIARYWGHPEGERPSGYHDPVTERFVQLSSEARRRRSLPITCFERTLDGKATPKPRGPRAQKAKQQGELFGDEPEPAESAEVP